MHQLEEKEFDNWLKDEMENQPTPTRFIPTVLKEMNQWVTWKTIDRDGKSTKVPFQLSGQTASSTDPSTWTSYDNINVEEQIGFVFSKEDDLVFIDLDKCYDGSKAEAWAQRIIDSLDSYTEISPSNTGFHIFIKAKIPGPRRRWKRIEMYQDGRYSTITGNIYQGKTEIKECQKEFTKIYNTIFPKVEPIPSACKPAQISLKDQELLDIAFMAGNGHRIKELFQGVQAGYQSQSEADFALCCHLAFYTQDESQIDRLFRGSQLIRNKWDEKRGVLTYGQIQVRNAISKIEDGGQFWSPEGPTARSAEVWDSDPDEVIEDNDNIYIFDDDLMIGIAKEFTDVYHEALPEIPKHYFYFAYLACFGNLISDQVKFKSELSVQARLYILFLGKSGKTRKSTAAKQVMRFYDNSQQSDHFFKFMGAGSGEGLGRFLAEHPRALYYIDELRTFMAKSSGDASSLLPMVCQLYDSQEYDNYLVKNTVSVRGVNLSILSACTLKTYEEIWKESHTNIGLASRLFIVPGEGKRLGLPGEIDPDIKSQLDNQLKDVIIWINDMSTGQHIQGNKLISFSTEAAEYYNNNWIAYLDAQEYDDDDVLNRVEVQTIKLLMLLSCLKKECVIDTDLLKNVIEVMKWQIAARDELTPTAHDNNIAYFETAIIKWLKKSPMTRSWLMNRLAAPVKAKGTWYFAVALDNLIKVGKIGEKKLREDDRKEKLFLKHLES